MGVTVIGIPLPPLSPRTLSGRIEVFCRKGEEGKEEEGARERGGGIKKRGREGIGAGGVVGRGKEER